MHPSHPTHPATEQTVEHTVHTGIDARPSHFGRYLLGAAAAGMISSALLALPRGSLWVPLVVLLTSQGCLIVLGTACLLGAMGYTLAEHTGVLGMGSWSACLVGACYGLGATFGTLLSTAPILASAGSSPTLLAEFVATLLFQAFITTLIFGLLGALVALIGSAFGRSQFRARQHPAIPVAANVREVDREGEPARDSE